MTRYNPYKLGYLVYETAFLLGEAKQGRSTTSSTTTTVIDASGNWLEADDYWNGGTLVVLTDTLTDIQGGSLFSPISDFVKATGTFTLSIALNAAPAGSEEFAAIGPRFNTWDYIAAVNAAIRGLGHVLYTRTGDITTAANQTEYPLVEKTTTDPPPLIGYNAELKRVRIQRVTTDSNDNQWEEIQIPWRVRKGESASAGVTPGMPVLIFDWQPPVGYDLELTIASEHPNLVLFGQRLWIELDAGIPPRLVVLQAALHLLNTKRASRFVHPRLNDILNELKEMQAKAERTFQPVKMLDEVPTFIFHNEGEGTGYRREPYIEL